MTDGTKMEPRITKTTRLITLMLAALFIGVFAACAKKVDSPKLEHSINCFYSPADGMTTFFMDSVKLSDQIAGSVTKIGTVDGTTGYVTAASALYHIDSTGMLKIYPAAVTNAVLSLDGRFILFATATEVLLYDHSAKEYTKLPEIPCKSIVGLVLSPNGDSAGITVVDSANRINSYVYSNGSLTSYGSDRCIAAIANGGKLSYYLAAPNGEVSGSLYYVREGKEKLIGENASNYFELNRDMTEITFDMDAKTYISRDGKTAKKLVDASVLSYAGAQYSTQGGKAVTTLVKNTNTLLDNIFYTDIMAKHEDGYQIAEYNVYYIDSTLNASELALGASQFTVAEDRKAILCTVDEGLYRVSVTNPKRPELIASGIYSYCCTSDLKTIYPIDTSGNLWRIENGQSSTTLLFGIQLAKMMQNGTVICYAPKEEGGTLLWLQGNLADKIATGVAYFEVFPQMTAYLCNYNSDSNTYDLYISTDGVNYTPGAEGVQIVR